MKPQKSSTTFIGIAGGSGSGKTTLATALHERLGARQSVIMSCDWYYKDFSHLSPADRAAVNFDHPDALDIDLFSRQIRQLQAGKPIVAPVYDFTTHRRTPDRRILKPTPIVLIEGILLFAIKPICTYLDLKIFVDAPADIRFIRRLKRDIEERGRTVDLVVQQYLTTTRPMHHAFVEPSKAAADVVVSGEEDIESLAGRVMEHIGSLN
jgi:uridine kinase